MDDESCWGIGLEEDRMLLCGMNWHWVGAKDRMAWERWKRMLANGGEHDESGWGVGLILYGNDGGYGNTPYREMGQDESASFSLTEWRNSGHAAMRLRSVKRLNHVGEGVWKGN